MVVQPNLGRIATEVLRRGGDRVAFRSVSSLTTCSELTIRIAQRAIELASVSAPGVAIGVETRNDVGTFVDFVAIWLGGGVVVPISRELPDIKVSELSERTNMAAIATRDGRVLHLERKFPSVAIPEEVALVLFTTGSTGAPKGVLIEHAGILAKLDDIYHRLELVERSTWLVTLRLEYSFAQWVTILGVLEGKTIWYCEPYDAGVVARTLGSGEIDAWFAVPSALGRLMQTDAWSELEGSTTATGLRTLVVGGEPIAPALADAVHRALPGAEIGVIYGLTETSTPEFVLAPSEHSAHPDSFGIPLAGVSVRIEPAEMAPGLGELWTKSAGLMRGYLGDDRATASVVQDGYIRTRDLVRDPGDGFLVHMGRVDDVISVRGFKVASGEVETLLRSVPGVAAAFVFKSEHDETLVAAIVSNGPVARSDLERAASLHLERFKRPTAYFQVAELPTKGLGKSDRREIVRRAAEGQFQALN